MQSCAPEVQELSGQRVPIQERPDVVLIDEILWRLHGLCRSNSPAEALRLRRRTLPAEALRLRRSDFPANALLALFGLGDHALGARLGANRLLHAGGHRGWRGDCRSIQSGVNYNECHLLEPHGYEHGCNRL